MAWGWNLCIAHEVQDPSSKKKMKFNDAGEEKIMAVIIAN